MVFGYLTREQEIRRKRELLSLWLTFLLVLALAAMAFILGIKGHDALSGTIFTTTVLGIAVIFVLRRLPVKF